MVTAAYQNADSDGSRLLLTLRLFGADHWPPMRASPEDQIFGRGNLAWRVFLNELRMAVSSEDCARRVGVEEDDGDEDEGSVGSASATPCWTRIIRNEAVRLRP